MKMFTQLYRKWSGLSAFASLWCIAMLLLASGTAQAVPSFSRQTSMPCATCHTVFPELTPFGRAFKLNGYQTDALPQIKGSTPGDEEALLLNQLPPFSFMFQASYTKTSKALPDSGVAGANAQNGQVLIPQQASIFYAGRLAPNLGSFVQITYDPEAGAFHLDNTDIRYATQASVGSNAITYGATLNNNPTVQDPWNSTPAWQTPFDQTTSVGPVPNAVTWIDGKAASMGVGGLTAYAWVNSSIYGEVGFYKSAPQGFGGPLDSTTPGGFIDGTAPYWRLAYENQWDNSALSVGAYGLNVNVHPFGAPMGSDTDKYRDVALDAQYQYITDAHIVSVTSTYIKEDQTLTYSSSPAVGTAANLDNTLKTFRIGASYYYQRRYGGALGYFSTTGTADALLYPAGAPTVPYGITGSANGKPDSRGMIAEVDYIPWLNVKYVLQYVAYNKFNGGSSNYDGLGRNAHDNNTLYMLAWFAF